MSAHTPGPWRVLQRKWGKDDALSIEPYDRPGYISILPIRLNANAEAHANARLIAAAPDLLTALKRLAHIAVWDEDFDGKERAEFDAAFAQAEAAIAKAHA